MPFQVLQIFYLELGIAINALRTNIFIQVQVGLNKGLYQHYICDTIPHFHSCGTAVGVQCGAFDMMLGSDETSLCLDIELYLISRSIIVN